MSETITLLVHGAFYRGDQIKRRVLTAEKNENLFAVLKRGGLYLHDCSGRGSCGKCKVRFVTGAPLPTAAERALLSAEELRAGVRLACRQSVRRDTELVIEAEAAAIPDVIGALPDTGAEPVRRSQAYAAEETGHGTQACAGEETGHGTQACAAEEPVRRTQAYAAEETRHASAPVFAAVDIGTTTIAMRGMCGGAEVGSYAALNPQRMYGADVVSRISAGMQGHAEDMRQQVCACLADGVRLIGEQCGRTPAYMVIAANTTMVHLLCGDSLEPLSAFPFEPVNIRPQQIVVAGIPAYIICGISAFVGGDVVSGMAATGLHNSSDLQLFIDLGTNGEIVLGKKGRFLCTATAAGSAFEGNGSVDLMGADLIRVTADALHEGIMDAHGLFSEPYFTDGLDRAGAHITQESIRELQKAKAAVAAGIGILLEQYGAKAKEVSSVLLAGGFGYYLDPEAAVRIGLLSDAFAGKIHAVGNTALRGACLIGNGDMRGFAAQTERLTEGCVYLNLAMQENFEKKYISNLDFPS
ncbi:MAG: ASKHA domain-containing protein [Clostridium sp.]|nr:ASKHA domain-containing protein [Clostridium sp.]